MKRNWLISLVINIGIAAIILLVTDMVYETSDDFVIASRIVDGYAEVFFVNYYLCKILILLQNAIPSINIYVAAQLLGSLISFTCIYKLILDYSKNIYIKIIGALLILSFAFDHYCTIQFTKTSALMLIAGTMLLADGITKKKGLSQLIGGALVLYTGVAFRIDGLIVAIGFAGIYLLIWAVENIKSLKKDGYFEKTRLITYLLVVLVIAGCYGFQNLSNAANDSTEALKEYNEYNECRWTVVDYPVFDYYENNVAEYDKIGISENDLYLIDHWFLDYDGAASKENLKKIIEVDNADPRPAYSVKEAVRAFRKDSVKSIKKLGFTGVHILLLVLVALWMFAFLKPRHWIYIVLVGAAAISVHIALYYTQRPGYRAIYIADVASAMWLLYYMSVNYRKEESDANTSLLMKAASICVAILIAITFAPLKEQCIKQYNGIKGRTISSEMREFLSDNEDKFYTISAREKRQSESYLNPMEPPDTESDKNLIGTGSWGTMSPYLLSKMEKYNIRNPIKDLINNDKAFYIGNKNISRIKEYYNKWYGSEDKQVYLEEVSEIDGHKVWQIKSY